jgi:hypothetical protein
MIPSRTNLLWLVSLVGGSLIGRSSLCGVDCNGNGIPDSQDLLPQGSGFVSMPDLETGQSPHILTVGDLNGDGATDIVTGNLESFDVTILLNDGDGRVMGSATHAVDGIPRSVLIADLNQDGKPDIAALVSNAFTGSGTVFVLLNQGAGAFIPNRIHAVGTYPYSMTSGDFNGDGAVDLATADNGCAYCGEPVPGGISVLLSIGDGSFAPAVRYASDAFPSFILAADFNADGKTDLAASHGGNFNLSALVGGGLWVLLNRGDGTFREPDMYDTAGYSLLAADLDGDGNDDLAVPTLGTWDGAAYRETGIWVHLNKGNGTFEQAAKYPAGDYPFSLTAADLNRDGRFDLLSANERSGDVSVLLNQGHGFLGPTSYPVGISPRSVIAADLDGDLDMDVAAATYGTTDFSLTDTSVAVLLNDGDGKLKAAARYGIHSGYADSLSAADSNGDGRLDLIVASQVSDRVALLLNKGDGSFASDAYAFGGYAPFSSAVSDLNGDGEPDLVAANYGCPAPACTRPVQGGVSVTVNQGDGTFQERERHTLRGHPVSLAITDFDGDARMDIATANEQHGDPGTVSVLLNDKGGSFVLRPELGYEIRDSYPGSLAAVDLNGDLKPDIAVLGRGAGEVSVLLNDGQGSFSEAKTYAAGAFPRAMTAADLDVDGDFDLVVADAGCPACELPIPGGIAVLRNRGDGSFEEAIGFAQGRSISDMVLRDLNGDGRLDLAAVNSGCADCSPADPASVLVLLNSGTGPFERLAEYRIGAEPRSLVASDLSGDGRIDLAVASKGVSGISVLINSGNGAFQEGPGIPAESSPQALIAADFDGDGHQDLVALLVDPGTGASSVLLFSNEGQGKIALAGKLFVGPQARSITTPDLNGDLLPDLLVSNARGLVVLLNHGKSFSSDLNQNGVPDECDPGAFHRGDSDASGTTNISDGIAIFSFLLLGHSPMLACNESADTDNDGTIDIADGIFLLEWLFVSGPEPAAPGPTGVPCGFDPDPQGSPGDLGCESYDHCG